MKRSATFVLVLIFLLSLSSCGTSVNYKGPLTGISHIIYNEGITTIDLKEDTQNKILSTLNSGEWVNDLTNCAHDYEFSTKNETIRYHSECGTFIDITNGRSMKLSDEDKADINRILEVAPAM